MYKTLKEASGLYMIFIVCQVLCYLLDLTSTVHLKTGILDLEDLGSIHLKVRGLIAAVMTEFYHKISASRIDSISEK
jgi:hypothetical protein